MNADQPVTLPVAIGGVITSAIAVAALLWPDRLSPELQASIIVLANAVILAATVVFTNARVTSSSNPVLKAGTIANVEGTNDTVTIQPSPPGPTGTDAGESVTGPVR